MKILHTSDWHLGHKFYNYDRKEEQIYFLRQIADIVKEQKPDVMVVSGDIFHTGVPNIDTQTMFVEELLHIHQQHESMEIVVTAGNHDSYSRLEIDKKLWNTLHIHIIGNVSADLNTHIIKIGNKGFVAAVPYCSERNFPQLSDEDANRQTTFFNALLNEVISQNDAQLPVVLMAHLAVRGCDTTGHKVGNIDDVECVGNLEYTSIDAIGTGYDYLALGHIHHPQFVSNNHRVRYSGTPFAVSFDEQYKHSVSMVEISKYGDTPSCSMITLDELRSVLTLPNCNEGTSIEHALELLKEKLNEKIYLRLNVNMEPEQSPAEYNFLVQEVLQAHSDPQCRFCLINPIRTVQPETEVSLSNRTIEEIRELSTDEIVEIAHQYFPLDDEQQQMLTEVIAEVSKEKI